MDKVKLHFIKEEFPGLLNSMQPAVQGRWGKMNGQQMVEHVADFFKVSTQKIKLPLVSAPEHLPKLKAFLLSDREFRENTKAPVLPDEPLPLRHPDMAAALASLKNEIRDFVDLFETEKELITQHPVFGDLNFEEWVLLHYKHVLHHAKQFGLIG
jgi:hypothetical protein